MDDLRVYLQNLCLGQFTGRKASESISRDPSLPMITTRKDGNLIVAEPKRPKKDLGEEHGHDSTGKGEGRRPVVG